GRARAARGPPGAGRDRGDELRPLREPLGGQPAEGAAIGIDLVLAAAHQRRRSGAALDFVKRAVQRVDEAAVEAVLTAAHGENENGALAGQVGHAISYRPCPFSLFRFGSGLANDKRQPTTGNGQQTTLTRR